MEEICKLNLFIVNTMKRRKQFSETGLKRFIEYIYVEYFRCGSMNDIDANMYTYVQCQRYPNPISPTLC